MKYLDLYEQILGGIIGDEISSLINRKLTEGGNIFKSAEWTKENPVMQTVRINRENVPATLAYLEKLTGLSLQNNLLGSTGITPTSGDMDIAVDMNTVSKDALSKKLIDQGVDPADIKRSGDSVHYKSPIADQHGHFVQVDFMFVPDVPFAVWANKTLADSNYKGVYKQRLLADLTRTVNPEWKWNQFRGVLNRSDNSSVFGFNPDKIAKGLLGSTGTKENLESVERILASLEKHPRGAEIKDAYRGTLARDPKGPQLAEAANPAVGREFQHLEDRVYIEGLAGVKKAVETILHITKNAGTLETKWDGSPAVVIGRDESGKFHFGDKYSKQMLSTPQEVYAYYTRTSDSEYRQAFAKDMASLFPLYERATPRNFVGFLEAGLLYKDTPPINERGEYYFKPNTVTYFVNSKTPLGKRVGSSKTGSAATGFFKQLPALGGQRNPVGNTWQSISSSDVVIIPPKFAQGQAKVDVEEVKSIYNYAKSHAQEFESFIAPETGLSDIRNIIYTYINSQVTNPSMLGDLGENFADWVQTSGKVSAAKQVKVLERLKTNSKGAEVLFNTVRAIMSIKDDLIDNMETPTLGSMGIRGELGKYGPGAEGFVYDVNAGQSPSKLVKRGAFTAANVDRDRTDESAKRIGDSNTAIVGWGRGMGHKGHMYLASAVITTAKQLDADPYFILSRTVGKDDPLTPEEKLSIYRTVFPEYKNIFQIASDDTPTLPAMLHSLQEQGYRNAVVVVGEDQKAAFQFLTKPTKSTGKLPVDFDSIKVISRQETSDENAGEAGPRATPMREILKNPDADYDEKFSVWRDAMPAQLSDEQVDKFMNLAAERMGVPLERSMTEADNPYYFGGSSQSAIPGTPRDLIPGPNPEEIRKYREEMADMKRFLGHRKQ